MIAIPTEKGRGVCRDIIDYNGYTYAFEVAELHITREEYQELWNTCGPNIIAIDVGEDAFRQDALRNLELLGCVKIVG